MARIAQEARLELLAAVAAFVFKNKDGVSTADIATRAQCSLVTAYSYLEKLRGEGLIYLRGMRHGRRGPPCPLWAWQYIGVFHMDDDPQALTVHMAQQEHEYRKASNGNDQRAVAG